MAAEHQRSSSELLQAAEERAADLRRSLSDLNQYLRAVHDAEDVSSRKSGMLSTMRFVTLARDISSQLVDTLHKARAQTPDRLQ